MPKYGGIFAFVPATPEELAEAVIPVVAVDVSEFTFVPSPLYGDWNP